ncbi:MAG: hypothetical protein H0X24_17240 [Ktedonobacterales bacterium]|nr:hypothetical protein [Ktedonobacterales bacterium]
MTPEPPPFLLRGLPSADDSLRIYHAAELALSLRCEVARGQVLVYGIIAQGYDAAPAILVRLLGVAAGVPLVVGETLVESGSFELGPLTPGVYQIEVLLPDRLLVIADVALPHLPSPIAEAAGETA